MWFNWNFSEICSQQWNWQWASTGSENSLAPNRRQAIITTNGGPIHWRIPASLGLNRLRHCTLLSDVDVLSYGSHKLELKFQTNLQKHSMKHVSIYRMLFTILFCNSGESSFGLNITDFSHKMTFCQRIPAIKRDIWLTDACVVITSDAMSYNCCQLMNYSITNIVFCPSMFHARTTVSMVFVSFLSRYVTVDFFPCNDGCEQLDTWYHFTSLQFELIFPISSIRNQFGKW